MSVEQELITWKIYPNNVIAVKTNFVFDNSTFLKKIETIKNPKPLLRLVAFDVLSLMDERIHEEGKTADGSQIGEYNNRYLKLRQKKFKLSGDKKIIVVQTRELRNSWAVLGTEKGWGIGFTKINNAEKLRWVEQQKKKKIGALTKTEKEYAITKLKKLVTQKLNT